MNQGSLPVRDTANLRQEELFSDYSKISFRRRLGAEATALRNGWVAFREILAHQATGGFYDYTLLKTRVLSGSLKESELVSPESLGSLGVISVVSRGRMVDVDFGLAALRKAIEHLPKNRKSYRLRKLIVEYYLACEDRTRALEMLDLYPDIDRQFYRYLRLDANNPFIASDSEDFSAWLEAFNEPFISNGLAPVTVQVGTQSPFMRLAGESFSLEVASNTAEVPLVSVVMAVDELEPELFLSAVRSVLNQSWKNIELVLVCQEAEGLFSQVCSFAEADGRISVVPLTFMQSYYEALNEGLRSARGDFVTFQSANDWSHPERIERQVKALQASGDRQSACIGQGITSTRDLGRSLLGREPTFFNPHSLMVAREAMDAVGGFLPVASGGAAELWERIDRLTGTGTIELSDPVTLSLVDNEESLTYTTSLESAHSSYRMFKSSYRHWHRHAKPSELCLNDGPRPKVMIPSYLRATGTHEVPELDVVFAGDWTRYGGPQKSMLEEIKALLGRGYKIGVMTLEAGRFMERVPRLLCAAIQELLNSGQIVQVFPDEELTVNLLVLRYPPILQFLEPKPMTVIARQAIVLANQAPSELDGSDIRYRINDCNENARVFFDCPYIWVPQGPQVREALLNGGLSGDLISDFDIPGIIDPAEWENDRVGFRGTIPVIGRHSRDNEMKWPDSANDIKQVYPLDGSLDVRIMGGAKAPLQVLDRAHIPPGWIVHVADEMPVKTFLSTLDYFVFYQHSKAVEAFGRAVLEAIGSGLVVILPPHFEPVFGAAAVYSAIDDVLPTIRSFHNDWNLYTEQVVRAKGVVETHFSHEAYGRLVDSFMEKPLGQNV